MQLILVNDITTAEQFLLVPVTIYKNDINWIRPLDKDINEVFDAKKNKAFRFGKIIRWLLVDENNQLIGRIAAFINSKYKNKGDDVPVGAFGFFECINSKSAADMLLNKAREWLAAEGMQAMDGPINFGERDKWWGLVTEGFSSPLYGMSYNPPYYVELLQNYGCQVFFNQICFGIDPNKPLSPKIHERHNILAANPAICSKFIDKKQLSQFAADFTTVYNKAWAGHGGLKQLTKEQVLQMFKKMAQVIDERIILFAYYNEEPIAIFLNLPDLNQYFKHLNGKFGLLQKLYFLYLQRFRPAKKFCGLVFGVVPEWQGKGVDAYIIGECSKIIQVPKAPYQEYEMQWIGDFNAKMINVAESFGDTYKSQSLVSYRYVFDITKEYKRHPML